jgi:hypothetical protein
MSHDRRSKYSVILRRIRAVIVAVGTNKHYIFWVCVCSLRYPACNMHAPYYMDIVACLALLYLSTFSHKRHDLKKKLLQIKRVFWFSLQLWPEIFLILRIIHRHMTKNIYRSSCEVLVILVRLQRDFNFLGRISKNTQIPNFLIICPVGAELFHADGRTDGRTDTMKLIVALRNFANAPKIDIYLYHGSY